MRHFMLALLALPLVLAQDPLVNTGAAPVMGRGERSPRAQALDLGLAYVRSGQTAEPDEELSESLMRAEEQPAQARRRRIEEEIARNPTHPWAGVYRYGDGLGMNIALWAAPESGAVYTWHGCLGLYDVNHGEIERASAEALQLKLAFDASHNWCIYQAGLPRPILSDSWLFATWGDEVFLIPAVQMIPFCNAVNDGDGWVVSNFPRRDARAGPGPDVTLPPGLPAVPSPYDLFLLKEPLTGLLTAVGDPVQIGTYAGGSPPKYQVSATLDVGLRAGMLPGMLVYTLTKGSPEGEVTAVAEGECTVQFRYPEGKEHVPQRGERVSTRSP